MKKSILAITFLMLSSLSQAAVVSGDVAGNSVAQFMQLSGQGARFVYSANLPQDPYGKGENPMACDVTIRHQNTFTYLTIDRAGRFPLTVELYMGSDFDVTEQSEKLNQLYAPYQSQVSTRETLKLRSSGGSELKFVKYLLSPTFRKVVEVEILDNTKQLASCIVVLN